MLKEEDIIDKCLQINCGYLKYDDNFKEYYCDSLGYFIKEIKKDNIKCFLNKKYPLLKFQLLNNNVYEPKRATSGSSGLDVFSPIDIIITPRKDILIPLDIRFEIPFGWDLSVYNKSGISTKKKLSVGANLIDGDYRGNCHIHFFNNSDEIVEIKKGDKISQLVMREVWLGELKKIDDISIKTQRGENGFGSTDKK
jgi:dUTP pyrophosphatase